jgi:ferredoxin-NADP reductase
MKAKYVFLAVLVIAFIVIGLVINKERKDRQMQIELVYKAYQVDSIIIANNLGRAINNYTEAKRLQPPLSPMRDYYQGLIERKKLELEYKLNVLKKNYELATNQK